MSNNNLTNGFNNDVETEDIFNIFNQKTEGGQDAGLEDVQELYQTMALQMEYTESLKDKKDSRKLEAVEFVEIDPQKSFEITQKLIEIYGSDSIQVRKWTEQLQKIEYYKEAQKKAIKKRKRQTVIMGILGGCGVLIIVAIIVFVLNSTSYYINQGDYNYIYKKPMFGAPQRYLNKSVLAMTKEGSDLYYIAKEDNKLYSLSTKSNESKTLTDDNVKEFKIIGDYIYYINSTDNNNLYRMSLNGGGSQKIYDKSCQKLSVDGKTLYFEDASTGKTQRLDTKTLTVSEG